MGLHHRKLISDLCEKSCYEQGPCSSEIDSDECSECLKTCSSMKDYYPPLPSPPIDPDKKLTHSKNNISTYLIIGFTIVATVFFLLCCYAIYAKFFSNRNRSRRRVLLSQQQPNDETRDDFVDEEHGPVVDHPIWYIRTTGLHQSIIDAIMVCKYKKGEGLIEGTECSVCLGEFEEDESLRLLPKCNHAFHLPCIDTWLRSHTNCPMCRAPIVTNPARILSMEHNVVDSSSLESSQIEESLENSGDGGSEVENGADELRNVEEEEGQVEEFEDGRRVFESEDSDARVGYIKSRRSVSLDSSSAAKINLALSTVLPVESHGNSEMQTGEVNGLIVSKRVEGNENLGSGVKGSSSFRTRYLQSAPNSMKRSRSFNGKHLLSWYGCSQKKPNGALRSF